MPPEVEVVGLDQRQHIPPPRAQAVQVASVSGAGKEIAMKYAIIENTLVVNIVVADAEFAQAQGWIDATGASIGDTWDGTEFIKPIVPPSPPPVLIATKYTFRMALLNIGLLDDIEDFISVTEDKAVKIAWQYADEYRTDDPLVLGMGYALGKTEEEIRAVFELANTL